MGWKDTWNNWIKDAQEFCYKHFKVVVVASGITCGGGVLALIFDPIFAIIVPLWVIFAAYVLKKGYKGAK